MLGLGDRGGGGEGRGGEEVDLNFEDYIINELELPHRWFER